MKLLISTVMMFLSLAACNTPIDSKGNRASCVFHVDSRKGDDTNDGLSDNTAWKTLSRVEQTELVPGDTIKFKRGSHFNTALYINYSGDADNYIVLTDYGSTDEAPPTFTNPVFDPERGVYGNCIRIRGSYVIVENLYCEHTVAELSGSLGFELIWELGAIYIDKGAEHCIVRNNEIFDCGSGIHSYGEHALITHNYVHDCTRVLKEWSWGAQGIWLSADYQEVCYNRIFNHRVEDPRITWSNGDYGGGGADGGAIGIDDARYPKSNIHIHHNYSRDNQGFIEVTEADVKKYPDYNSFSIHHNVSDDYQQFIALWWGTKCRIENNTIIRRKRNQCDWGVFNITQGESYNYIRNNLVVVENDVEIFPEGGRDWIFPKSIISNNLYFAAAGSMNMGLAGPGENPVFADPQIYDYSSMVDPGAFRLTSSSPAVDAGLDLGYTLDFFDTAIPQRDGADIGAFELE